MVVCMHWTRQLKGQRTVMHYQKCWAVNSYSKVVLDTFNRSFHKRSPGRRRNPKRISKRCKEGTGYGQCGWTDQ